MTTSQAAIERARRYFLTEDNAYGCAETALVVLQEAYGLPDPTDSAPAMALNGGVAWSGGMCGAITGAALAVGRLAAERVPDHNQAKRVARGLVGRLIAEFRAEFGATDCRDLIGLDISIPAQHAAFIQSGAWRESCMRQLEFVAGRLAVLEEKRAWDGALRDLVAGRQG